MKNTTTQRGFQIGQFTDSRGSDCVIQQSSDASDYYIWLGIHNPKLVIFIDGDWVDYTINPDVLIKSAMHLNREQVASMLPMLTKFVETGNLY